MKSLNRALLALSLLAGVAANAAQYPIGFQVVLGAVAPFSPVPGTPIELANEAFLVKYGAEFGVLGTGQGLNGQLVVFVSDRRVSRDIWRKMIGAGDAFAAANGAGYIYYEDGSTTPTSQYVYYGKLNIQEGYTGTFPLVNGTPAITGFMVAVEEKCGIGRAGVTAIQPPQVAPTRLVGSKRIGSYSIGYEYAVNGGQGALVSGVSVSIARRHFGPFIVDICPVDLYLRY